MKNRLLSVLLLCVLAACVLGCKKTRHDHIEEFKNEFNAIAPSMRGGAFRSVYLEDDGVDSLKVSFVLNTIADDADRAMLEKMSPSIAYSMLKNASQLDELIASGAAVRIVFISSDAVELTNQFFDKYQLQRQQFPVRSRMAKRRADPN